MPTATSTTSQPGQRRPASRESKDTRAARLLFNINTRDQITGSEHGGPLHVSGTLNRPGKIASTGSSETPTALDGSFSAWVDAPASGPATVSAQDYSSNFVNTPTAPSYNTGLQRAYTFTYDANGNMTSKTPVGGGATVYYTWDAMDRLVEVSTGSSYEYDGLGRRVRINQTSGQPDPRDFRFVWDGLKPVRALGMLEDIPLEVVYYDQGMFILLDNEPYDYIYTQKDHLGSNRNGYAYDAYGNLTDWDNEAPPWFERLYTGHLYDASAGLYLAPYRSYDPELGRWLSREPLGLDGPNLYHYVGNRPVKYTDPTGLQMYMPGGPTLTDKDANGLPDSGPYISTPFRDSYIEFRDATTPYGQEAMDYYADVMIDPNSGFWDKAGAGAGGHLASLWTPCTADATASTLAGSWGPGAWAGRPYWRYVSSFSNPNSKYLTRGWGWGAPYGRNFPSAKDKLALPHMPTEVVPVHVPWWRPVRGPYKVKPHKDWGAGGGTEYLR